MCCSEDTTSRPDGLNNALRPFEELWVPELFADSVRSARGEPDASDSERWVFPCLASRICRLGNIIIMEYCSICGADSLLICRSAYLLGISKVKTDFPDISRSPKGNCNCAPLIRLPPAPVHRME